MTALASNGIASSRHSDSRERHSDGGELNRTREKQGEKTEGRLASQGCH